MKFLLKVKKLKFFILMSVRLYAMHEHDWQPTPMLRFA